MNRPVPILNVLLKVLAGARTGRVTCVYIPVVYAYVNRSLSIPIVAI